MIENPLYAPLILLAAAVLAMLALAWAWLRSVAWFYRLKGERPTVLRTRCADRWELAVYHRRPTQRRFAQPVLLCHGLATNHHYFDFDEPHSVAHYLAQMGFECFTVEWRGTGASARPPRGRRWSDYSADDHIRFDGPALIDFALEKTGASTAFWLGHSLGALVGYAVAQGPAGPKLEGLCALGAPAFFPDDDLLKGAVRAFARIQFFCSGVFAGDFSSLKKGDDGSSASG